MFTTSLVRVHEALSRLPSRHGLRYRGNMRQLLMIAIAFASTPAFAAATAWQELSPGVKLRLIASETRDADGRTLLGLELDMPQDHKTYWQVPGESGIPTTLDLSGSAGIEGHEMLWPYPTVETTEGLVDFVYHGPTVLPVEASVPADRALVRASVVMGICSDICIPASASFELPLQFSSPDRAQALRLDQAVALAPIAWDETSAPVGAPGLDPTGEWLLVPDIAPEVDPLSIIASAGLDGPLFGAPQKSPDGTLVRLPLLGGAKDGSATGATVSLTFMTARGAFEVTRQIAPSGSTESGL